MKAYKGFDKNMQCRGFQYAEGETYELPEGQDAKLCERGFHACERPVDVLQYYPAGEAVFHEVEVDGVDAERGGDANLSARKIHIGPRLSIEQMVQATIEYNREHCTTEHTDPAQASAGYRGAASAGDGGAASAGACGAASAGACGAASAGESGAASAGYRGAASAGESGAASAGESGAASAGACGAASAGACGAASAGDGGAASAGDGGAASAGNSGAASAGDGGAASAGYRGAASAGACGAASAGVSGAASAGACGAAVSRGSASVGANGIACVKGNGCRIRGGLGAVLVIAEENSNEYDIASWRAVIVDGETIKEDTWYELVNGEFVEAADE